jgi:ribosomal protein S12 methylthiotransferase
LNLGCPKNLVDAEVMLGHLSSAGYQICTDKELADNTRINYDIFIINTCCFIKEAEDESRDIIQKAIDIKDKADIKIIVSGCLAQRYAGQLYKEFDREIDGIMGLSERDKIVQLCTNLLKDNRYQKYRRTSKDGCRLDGERLRITPQHYAYLRIAEGCDNRCSYCIIPDIHGPYRSKPLDAIIEEAIFLVSQGTKEINLIAQDTTSYGKDFRSSVSLSALLKELAKIKDLEWIRLLYTHPAHFTDELIDTISQLDKVVKYIDLPIQHISNNILSLMGRHISSDGIKRLISKIREKIPDVFIRTTVIVGFPGETESDFKKLLDFIREIEFERLGAFQYSREKNTPAYRLDKQLPITVKEKRLDSIMSLQQKIAFRKNESLINKSLSTIIDEPYKDMVYSQQNQDKIYLGRTYGDAPEVDGNIIIKTNANRGLSVGDIIRVKVTGTEHYDLVGEL